MDISVSFLPAVAEVVSAGLVIAAPASAAVFVAVFYTKFVISAALFGAGIDGYAGVEMGKHDKEKGEGGEEAEDACDQND